MHVQSHTPSPVQQFRTNYANIVQNNARQYPGASLYLYEQPADHLLLLLPAALTLGQLHALRCSRGTDAGSAFAERGMRVLCSY
jgi:hypothetical protein